MNSQTNQVRSDFKTFWLKQLTAYDCDPSIYMMKYLIARQELNIEQRYWLCFLFANTYQLPTAWVMWNEFPDYQYVHIPRVAEWNEATKHRLPYQKDQKWHRGHLAKEVKSYQQLVGKSQRAFFAGKDYETLWAEVQQIYKFGRYTAWFYLQALKEVCGLDLEPTTLHLGDNSSALPRQGLCRILGYNDWAEDKKRSFSKEEVNLLEEEAKGLLEECRSAWGHKVGVMHVDLFAMETSLCAFAKLFRRKQGRYIGYYLDRQAEDIKRTSSYGWDGIDWTLLWECRDEMLDPGLNRKRVDKQKMTAYLDTGKLI